MRALIPEFIASRHQRARNCSASLRSAFSQNSRQLFFHGMNLKKGTIDAEQSIEPGFAVRFKRIVITQQQETASFKGLLTQRIEFCLVVAPELIDGLVHERDYMEPVKNNLYAGQCFTDRPEVGTAHVHCHSFQFSPSPGQSFQKGPNILFALSFDSVQDPAGIADR